MKNAILDIVAAGLLLANFALRSNPAKRSYEVLPDMAHSPAYDSFDANPNFKDGRTLREPVPGTVMYASLRMQPLPAGPQALARGAVVYDSFCAVCHGPTGKGDGTVALRGFPTPPSLLAPNARKLTDEQIFGIVTNGRNNMPSYASQVDRDDRWRAILFVRSLQEKER